MALANLLTIAVRTVLTGSSSYLNVFPRPQTFCIEN